MGRALVIGLDAATLDLIEPWVREHKLPVFERLMRKGTYGTLWSTVPAISPPAWTSIITGQNPGRHGIYDFVRRQPGTYRLQSVRSDFVSNRTIFDLLSAYDKRVAAVNIPMTYPPSPVNGIMISGLGTPTGSQEFAHPPQLAQELADQGYYPSAMENEYIPGQDDAFAAGLVRTTHEWGQLALDLFRREPWDLFFVVLREIDEAQSFLWHHMDPTHPWHDPALRESLGDAILKVYQASEDVLQSLIEAAGEDVTVFIVSDHGGGDLLREVYLNAWLRREGWLTMREPNQLSSLYQTIMRQIGLTRDSLSKRLTGFWALKLRQALPLSLQHALLPGKSPTLDRSVDWSRTYAYSFGCIGQIYVNLKGREPAGIVQPGQEYERLIAEITEGLYQLEDPDHGIKVVDRVYRRDEIYHGPYDMLGPDLCVIMQNMSYITHLRRELASTDVFGPVNTHESGMHRPNGVFIASGEKVAQNQEALEASVVDIVPTILSVMGIPIPDDVDGRVLHRALQGVSERDEDSSPPIQDIPDIARRPVATEWEDEEDEQAVMDRLRRLGYLA